MHLSREHSIAQLPEPVPDLAKGRTQVTAPSQRRRGSTQ